MSDCRAVGLSSRQTNDAHPAERSLILTMTCFGCMLIISCTISKIKESTKTKQKIEDNPLEKEEEGKRCMFV